MTKNKNDMKMYITQDGTLDARKQADDITDEYTRAEAEARAERRSIAVYYTIIAIATCWGILCNAAMIYFIVKWLK